MTATWDGNSIILGNRTVALNNRIIWEVACPSCQQPYEAGFEISEGAKFAANIAVSDVLPWSKEPPPTGTWETDGIGQCLRCGAWVKGMACFDGLTFLGMRAVQLDE